MEDIDFSGVEPLRLSEAKRRAAIVQEYISEEKRSVAETDEFAQRMGVSRNQFYVIARAWRIYRDPARLGLKGGSGSQRGARLDSTANAILEEELEAADDLTPNQTPRPSSCKHPQARIASGCAKQLPSRGSATISLGVAGRRESFLATIDFTVGSSCQHLIALNCRTSPRLGKIVSAHPQLRIDGDYRTTLSNNWSNSVCLVPAA